MSPSSFAYVPALTGIRAVAVIAVMGYHGGVFFTAGGFYGVDTFFALSGFLITGLLLAEWERGSTIGLRRFWARRARRLLPALLVVLFVVALVNAVVLPPGTYPDLRGDGLAALLYVANWHFILVGSNYFTQTGPTSPLTHLWSLAVEEQFYLVWPLVVFGVMKLARSKRVLLAVCLAGAVTSAVEMAILYSPGAVNRIYYGTDTRSQSLLLGAALAVALSMWTDRHGRVDAGTTKPHASSTGRLRGRLVPLVGLAGAAGTFVLWTTVSDNDPFAYRGGFFLAALATTAVITAVVLSERSLLARTLSTRPLMYVGTVSYGLYLWHFPLFLFLDQARTGLTGFTLFALRAGATSVLSVASFHCLENPIRKGTFLRGLRGVVAWPLVTGAVVAALFAGTTVPAFAVKAPPMAPADVAPPAAAAATPVAARPSPRVLWVGDSTALTLGIALSAEQGAYGVQSADGALVGCGVTDGAEFELKGVDAPMPPACSGLASEESWAQRWRADIALYQPNVVIILVGRWEVADRTWNGSWTNIENPAYAAYVKGQLQYATEVAGSGGAHVVLMTAPCYDSGEQPDGDPWPEDSPERLSVFNQIVRQVAASSPHTSLLDLDALVCPGGTFEESLDGVPIRQADGVHFALGSGQYLAPRIWPRVVALLTPPPASALRPG